MEKVAENKKSVSIFLVPLIICFLLVVTLEWALIRTQAKETFQVTIFSFVLLLFWAAGFIFSQKRNRQGMTSSMIDCHPLYIVILSIAMGVNIACVVWPYNGYLNLSPIAAIDNGTIHLDTLFHSSISESFNQGLIPSTLINNAIPIHYHTFSHLLITILSKITGISVYLTYNWIYPVFFLPIYVFSQLMAISAAKRYFEGETGKIGYIDLVLVSLFVIGALPGSVLDEYGVTMNSFMISQSFLVSNTLLFFSLSFLFSFLRIKKTMICIRKNILICLLYIPVSIFIISWAKISVGTIYTALIMYYVFRTETKNWKGWLLNLLYGLTFIVSRRLFNSSTGSSLQNSIRLFAFGDYCSGRLGIWGHILLLSAGPILFIWMEYKKNQYSISDVRKGKTIWIEEMLITMAVGFAPCILLDIHGGSASYFSYVISAVSLVFLCSHSYINIERDSMGLLKEVLKKGCIIWCVAMSVRNSPGIALNQIVTHHNSNLYQQAMELREMTDHHPERYTIFLDQDAFVTSVFHDRRSCAYLYPALTGISVINGSYIHNGEVYLFTDSAVSAYSFNSVDHDKYSLNEAIVGAKKLGKKYLIHMKAVKYDVIDLEQDP